MHSLMPFSHQSSRSIMEAQRLIPLESHDHLDPESRMKTELVSI